MLFGSIDTCALLAGVMLVIATANDLLRSVSLCMSECSYFFAFTSSPWIVYLSRLTLGSYCAHTGAAVQDRHARMDHMSRQASENARHRKSTGATAWTYHFPSTRGENVLVLLVPMALDDFARMRLAHAHT